MNEIEEKLKIEKMI